MTNSLDINVQIQRGKIASKLSFFIAGFALSSWAPLVPYAKDRLDADTNTLGTILLCLGLGAVLGMPLASVFASKVGCRKVIIIASIGLIITLPLLAYLTSLLMFAFVLFLFGLCIGAIDVTANIHGTQVQGLAKKPLMSSFHGFYSIGGLLGVSVVTLFLASIYSSVVAAALFSSIILIICIIFASTKFLEKQNATEKTPLFVLPRGVVFIIGLLCLLVFLAEGAYLDWGAILLVQDKNTDLSISGSGYVIFALALTISRFTGDYLVAKMGEIRMLFGGLCFTALGILLTAYSANLVSVLIAIGLTGLAAGNLVPILFSLTAKQTVMPISHAISAVSFLGYLGVLLGPAMIGYIADMIGLNPTFYVLGFMTLVITAIIALSRKMIY